MGLNVKLCTGLWRVLLKLFDMFTQPVHLLARHYKKYVI